MHTIDKFDGDYFFLSNFFAAPMVYDGRYYTNSEAAFQSMKCRDLSERNKFSKLDPSSAKRAGRSVKLRPDWEDIKDGIMYDVCLAKFSQNLALCERLLMTGDAMLIEGNTWGDKEWGVCDGEGKNKLGIILMKIRDDMKIAYPLIKQSQQAIMNAYFSNNMREFKI